MGIRWERGEDRFILYEVVKVENLVSLLAVKRITALDNFAIGVGRVSSFAMDGKILVSSVDKFLYLARKRLKI